MKKYNFLVEPPDPTEPTGDSTGSLSPQAKRLLIIGILGIVLAGALFLYKSYIIEAPAPPPPPLALREKRVQPPPTSVQAPQVKPERMKKPAVPLMRSTPPAMKPKTVDPPVASRTPAPEKARATAVPPRPKREPVALPLRVAKPAESPRAIPEPPPAETKPEKPIPKTVAKVTKPEIEVEKRYALQVASLVVEGNVRSLKKRLEKLGYRPVIRKITAPIKHHRVYAGEFTNREEAEQTARRLNVDGVPSNLVEIEGGKFRLEVGSSFRLNEAIDLARSLQEKNYTPKIMSEVSYTTVHQIRVGAYANRGDARKALEVLKKKGFAPLVVKR